MNYDPYRIRFYDRKFFLVFTGSSLLVLPMVLQGIIPDYKGPFKGQSQFEDRTVIVTGATGNLGPAICQHYARRKFRVIMACRDMEQCKIIRRELVLVSRNNAIACRKLDLEDVDSINNFANEMIKTEPHINVLINNASIKHLEKKELTKYGIEKMYFVNFLAPYLLTFRLLSKLEKTAEYAGDARVINILPKPKRGWKVDTSDINFDNRKYKSDDAYHQSKLALAYFTILLERYNRDKGNNVYVYGASPCFKSIRESRCRPVTTLDKLNQYQLGWHSIGADQAASNAAQCGIDPSMPDRVMSGKLYTYLLRSWGWGIADKNEAKANHVWNHARKLLLDIPDTPKKIDPDKPNDSEVQPSDGAISKKDDQINKV